MSDENDITDEVREALEESEDDAEGSSDSSSEPIATLDSEGQADVGAPHVDGEVGEDDDVPTITLEVKVPAPGATDEQVQMYEEFADIFESRFDTFVRKNLDYGSSFLTAGQVDQALSGKHAGPFDTEREANLYKLFTRIQDKDQRFYQQTFCGGQDLVGEDVAETAGDAGVYWFMIEWLARYGE